MWPIAIIKWVDIVYNRVERGFYPLPGSKKIQISSKTAEQKNKDSKK